MFFHLARGSLTFFGVFLYFFRDICRFLVKQVSRCPEDKKWKVKKASRQGLHFASGNDKITVGKREKEAHGEQPEKGANHRKTQHHPHLTAILRQKAKLRM